MKGSVHLHTLHILIVNEAYGTWSSVGGPWQSRSPGTHGTLMQPCAPETGYLAHKFNIQTSNLPTSVKNFHAHKCRDCWAGALCCRSKLKGKVHLSFYSTIMQKNKIQKQQSGTKYTFVLACFSLKHLIWLPKTSVGISKGIGKNSSTHTLSYTDKTSNFCCQKCGLWVASFCRLALLSGSSHLWFGETYTAGLYWATSSLMGSSANEQDCNERYKSALHLDSELTLRNNHFACFIKEVDAFEDSSAFSSFPKQ